jgi:hypothetical protein
MALTWGLIKMPFSLANPAIRQDDYIILVPFLVTGSQPQNLDLARCLPLFRSHSQKG